VAVQIDLNATWLLAFLLSTVRAGAWLAVVPPFQVTGPVPKVATVGVAAGLGLLSAPLLEAHGVPTTSAGLIGSVVLQVVTGVALGLVVSVLISTVGAAGGFIDLFGGINPPPSMDPLSENQEPLIGQLYSQVAIVCLFVSNGELLLVRGFELSFTIPGLPIGNGHLLATVLVGDLATLFTAALEIAAPVVVVLFALQVALALLAKAAPQLNAWWLGLPAQVLLALLLTAIAIRFVPAYVSDLVGRALGDTRALLLG
jgi:flagellar biosynthetic protein FliR